MVVSKPCVQWHARQLAQSEGIVRIVSEMSDGCVQMALSKDLLEIIVGDCFWSV